MRWGKFILFFQAIATLLIGIGFFVQIFSVPYIPDNSQAPITGSVTVDRELAKYEFYKNRLFQSSYILVVIGLIEIIIIWRLFDEQAVSSFDTEFDVRGDFKMG
ncbi:MAG: hypothetical protein ACI86P_002461 [Flavobacteriales bacterium]|jgi:hypothetical protein